MLSHVRPSISKIFYLVILLGLIIRIWLAFFSLQFPENPDILRFKDWTRISYLYGFKDTYRTTHISFGTFANNLPPGSLYLLSEAYNLQLQTAKLMNKITHTTSGSNVWVNGPMVSLFLRIPSIVADLILSLLIYLLVKKHTNEKSALIALSLFLFNPIILYNSAFWGQIDALPNVFFVACLFFFSNKRYFWSILMFFLSLFMKLSLLPMIVPLFFLLIKTSKSQIKLAVSTLGALVIILILTLPVTTQPLMWLVNLLIYHSGSEVFAIAPFGFNFWWVIFRPWISIGPTTSLFQFSQIKLYYSPYPTDQFLSIPLSIWADGLFLFSLIPIIFIVVKRKLPHLSVDFIFLIFSLIAFLIFFLLPGMHERYLYPMFPLLATYVGLTGKYLKLFIIFIILNFINLYIVWHPMMIPFFNRTIMNNQNFQWSISILTCIAGIYFYVLAIKKLTYEKIV